MKLRDLKNFLMQLKGMIDIDSDYRDVLEPLFNLDDADTNREKKLFKFYVQRWNDFLITITDNIKGDNGEDFASKWQEKIETDQRGWLRTFISSYSLQAKKSLADFHLNDFVTCSMLFEYFVLLE